MDHSLDHRDHGLDNLDHIPAVIRYCAGSVVAQIQPLKHVLYHADHTDHDLAPIFAALRCCTRARKYIFHPENGRCGPCGS